MSKIPQKGTSHLCLGGSPWENSRTGFYLGEEFLNGELSNDDLSLTSIPRIFWDQAKYGVGDL